MSRTTTTKTISLSPELAAAISKRAAALGVSESLLARWALEQYLNLRTVDVAVRKRKGKRSGN
jgi:predicted transcriptional regulator